MTEAVRFFSHLINSQYKWMARILNDPKAPEMDWWMPVYLFEELEGKWNDSLQHWIGYLEERTEEQMYKKKRFVGFDEG